MARFRFRSRFRSFRTRVKTRWTTRRRFRFRRSRDAVSKLYNSVLGGKKGRLIMLLMLLGVGLLVWALWTPVLKPFLQQKFPKLFKQQ